MKMRTIPNTNMSVTPIGLGTWVTGGWMWGGVDETDALKAITVSLENGINLIDTAPIYGFGKSESLVGKALKKTGLRKNIILATKFGLEWNDKGRIRRNSSRARMLQEFDDSLSRLQTDYIDIYQVHWPDSQTPFEETMSALTELHNCGKIRAIGVSNFSVAQIKECLSFAPVHTLQPPFNLFEQESAEQILPFCVENSIATLTYGTLCRGLLTGKFSSSSQFKRGDIRHMDPKFKGEQFVQYLKAVDKLKLLAEDKNSTVTQLTIEWTINQPGITCALIGARNPDQAYTNVQGIAQHIFDEEDFMKVNIIIRDSLNHPIGPEFMAPS